MPSFMDDPLEKIRILFLVTKNPYFLTSLHCGEEKTVDNPIKKIYRVFQGFSKAKSANGGSILRSSQFLILPQLPQKIKLASKVV
jgi:hypothetical protein